MCRGFLRHAHFLGSRIAWPVTFRSAVANIPLGFLIFRCEVDTTIDVTSKDLHLDTSHPEIVPIGHKDFGGDNMVNKPVVIVKMRRGQELKLKAVAVKVRLR